MTLVLLGVTWLDDRDALLSMELPVIRLLDEKGDAPLAKGLLADWDED